MNTSPQAIFAKLKKVAPNIAFSVERTSDPNFVWDGDGPDPAEEGYVAYDVDVYARAIVDGEVVEGQDSLGGVYDLPDELDPDVNGYLPQMLEEATVELMGRLRVQVNDQLQAQGAAALKYLKDVLHARSEEQRKEEYKRRMKKKRWGPQ